MGGETHNLSLVVGAGDKNEGGTGDKSYDGRSADDGEDGSAVGIVLCIYHRLQLDLSLQIADLAYTIPLSFFSAWYTNSRAW